MFKEYVIKNKENIINTISNLVKFESISIETNIPDAPFGEECKKALEYTLNLGKQMGFRTKNIDGYCGYIEFGEGEEMLGIIGHLDVVPASQEDGWTTPPFEPSIRDNKIFGRGTIDDKGPVVASLYAMKIVADSCKLTKRVRLILGLNEECSWKCINRYKQTEEFPTISFSPDANFPAIYAEKGILSLSITNNFSLDNFEILEINCNNNALNVVPKYASITLKYTGTSSMPVFENTNQIAIKHIAENTIQIIATGIASHAAHPELGKNAITILVNYLLKYFKNNYLQSLSQLGLFDIESPEFLARKDILKATEFEDVSVVQDESGILTSNIGHLEYDNKKLTIKINLRIPVHTKIEDIIMQYQKLNNIFENIEINVLSKQEPLLVDKNSFLVSTLVNIYNKITNSEAQPIAIGGGTYARAFNNCVSYGVTMPGDLDMCHQVDEFIDIDKLIISTEIYAKAIYELAK